MTYTPHFSDTERTAAQRSESVKFAVGVTMSQDLAIPAPVKELYKRYISGEIDIAYIAGEIDRMYPQVPTTDPRYQPGRPTDRYYPELVEPAVPNRSQKNNRQLVLE
jgi:hypothetical protein